MTCSGQFVAHNDINKGVPRTHLDEIQPTSANTHLIASHPMAIKGE